MQRPLGARDDPVVVEHPQGADAHLLGIPVAVEREVPAGVEPAALLVPDGVSVTERDRACLEAHAPTLRPTRIRGAVSTVAPSFGMIATGCRVHPSACLWLALACDRADSRVQWRHEPAPDAGDRRDRRAC